MSQIKLNVKRLHKRKERPAFRNAFSNNHIEDLVLNRELLQSFDHNFSNIIKKECSISNQGYAGTCWIHAYVNMIRVPFIEKYKLDDDFEFSHAHLFFWDKLQRCNFFLNKISQTSSSPLDDRHVEILLWSPIGDGGYWQYFVNLVKAHGLMPKANFKNSLTSVSSSGINRFLKTRLREYAKSIRESEKSQHKTLIKKMNGELFDILCDVMGRPPETFTWEYYDKKKEKHTLENVTPLTFYKEHVPFNCDDYVCLSNMPDSEVGINKWVETEHCGNIIGAPDTRVCEQPIEVISEVTMKSLKDNMPVGFSCDVSKFACHHYSVLDTNLYDYESVFGSSGITMTKEDLLKYHESYSCHAMLFTGVDIVKTDGYDSVDEWEGDNHVSKRRRTETRKWRVANSWGIRGVQSGYLTMSNDWFNRYVYRIVVNKKYLTDEQKRNVENAKTIKRPIWD